MTPLADSPCLQHVRVSRTVGSSLAQGSPQESVVQAGPGWLPSGSNLLLAQ